MKRIILCDRVGYNITKREHTDEGFLKVPGRVARSGTQDYLASELGLTDRPANDIVTIYRPPAEVFDVASLNSYNGADVTLDHPSDLVNPATYKDVTVGNVTSAGRQDGDFIECDLIIKAADGIAAVESGKVQLSAGYTAEYDHAPGVTPDGIKYEFIQRHIKINHVALVDRARAGFQARLHDSELKKGLNMPKIVLDSRQVEVNDEATAALVNDHIERLNTRALDAEAEKEKAEAEAEKMKAGKDVAEEKLEDEKKKSSDAAITERIAAITSTLDSARAIAGPAFTCDSVDPLEIKRAALAATSDSVEWADKSSAYIDARFDVAVELGATETADAGIVNAQRAKLAKDAATETVDVKNEPSARQKANDSMSSAWKATTGDK